VQVDAKTIYMYAYAFKNIGCIKLCNMVLGICGIFLHFFGIPRIAVRTGIIIVEFANLNIIPHMPHQKNNSQATTDFL
jgi:hypothetical protein